MEAQMQRLLELFDMEVRTLNRIKEFAYNELKSTDEDIEYTEEAKKNIFKIMTA